MTPTAKVILSPDDIAQVVDDIAQAFLGTPATRSAGTAPHAVDVVAAVHISGAFRGSVICSTSTAFAVFAASRMLAVEPGHVDDEALVDALGEVANMVGGSVKALLPEPSTLSLPLVAVGDSRLVSVPGAGTVTTVDLRCADEPLRISVLSTEA
jgi:chemotaxis protein CheX